MKKIKFIGINLIVILCVLFLANKIEDGKKYKQYAIEQLEFDDYIDSYRTPYLSLPKGNYEVILGYHAIVPTVVTICNQDFILEASTGDNESFQILNVVLTESADNFCIQCKDLQNIALQNIELYEYEVKMSKPYTNDAYYIGFIFILCFILLSFIKYKDILQKLEKEQIICIVFLLGGIIFSSLPLFSNYLICTHDLDGHMKRIEGLRKAIEEGHLIPILFPEVNNGLGDLSFCYPYLYLYIPAILRILGVSMPFAWNTLMFLTNIGTGIICYFSIKEITKTRYSALIGALIYLFLPYRLLDMYTRAALGEVVAMAFIPLVIAILYNILFGDTKKYWLLSVGLLCILSSHILSIGITGIMMLMILLCCIKEVFQKERFIALLKAGGIFLGVTIPYMLVFLKFYKEVSMSDIKVVNFYKYTLLPSQLFMVSVNGYAAQDLKDGLYGEMLQSLGLIGGFIILGLIIFLIFKKAKHIDIKFIYVINIVGLIFLYMSTCLCPWNLFESNKIVDTLIGMIQFPYRFLTIVTVIIAFDSAFLIKECFIEENVKIYKTILGSISLILALIGAYNLLDDTLGREVYVDDIKGGLLTWIHNENFPPHTLEEINVDTIADAIKDNNVYTDGVNLISYQKHGTNIDLEYEKIPNSENSFIRVPLFYYSVYKAKDENGKPLNVYCGERNRVAIEIPSDKEKGSIHLYYSWF